MSIKVMTAPRGAEKLLREGVERHLAAGMVDTEMSTIQGLAAPHRVFNMGLDELVAGTPIAKAAKLTGWRSLLLDGKGRAIAAAELAQTRQGLKFASVSRGPHATGSTQSQAAAEQWTRRAKGGDHELTLLRVPGAYCMALWLRSADGQSDVFIPIAPCPSGLEPNRPYSEREFTAALMPEARKQLDAPQEGSGPR
jgi:hypothetical protein